jgi:ferredoxin
VPSSGCSEKSEKGQEKVTLSRKEFFQQGLFSLGDTVLKASGILRGTTVNLLHGPDQGLSDPDGPEADEPRLARAINECCLARNCGCFSCVERCELQAISVVMGEGIRIDEDICTGCGSCAYVCPVTPRAIRFEARTVQS